MIAKILNVIQKAYDDCYNSVGFSSNGSCPGRYDSDPLSTSALQEECERCPYFHLDVKDIIHEPFSKVNDSFKGDNDMNVTNDEPKNTAVCLFGQFAYFEDGMFRLNKEGVKILHDESKLITSYSGADYWCNHFICELLDIYSGTSEYNYSLGTIQHQKEIAQGWNNNKDSIIQWFYTNSDKSWFKLAEKSFDSFMINIRDNADIFKNR